MNLYNTLPIVNCLLPIADLLFTHSRYAFAHLLRTAMNTVNIVKPWWQRDDHYEQSHVFSSF